MAKTVLMVASGDLRPSANQMCWPAQAEMERRLGAAIEAVGFKVVRGHLVDEIEGHGFISSQKQGMAVFAGLDPETPLIVAEAVWQYSHHVLPGLFYPSSGPILTVANWSGEWPGLVGMLNLNGSLTKAGVPYSTLWSDDFDDEYLSALGLDEWLETGARVTTRHQPRSRAFDPAAAPDQALQELAGTSR